MASTCAAMSLSAVSLKATPVRKAFAARTQGPLRSAGAFKVKAFTVTLINPETKEKNVIECDGGVHVLLLYGVGGLRRGISTGSFLSGPLSFLNNVLMGRQPYRFAQNRYSSCQSTAKEMNHSMGCGYTTQQTHRLWAKYCTSHTWTDTNGIAMCIVFQ
jgi:hypothetical protein